MFKLNRIEMSYKCAWKMLRMASLFLREKEENELPVRDATGDESPVDGAYPVDEAKKKFDWTGTQAQSLVK